MDLVHVVRHKVLVEGRTQRAVARELGLARVGGVRGVERSAGGSLPALSRRPVRAKSRRTPLTR